MRYRTRSGRRLVKRTKRKFFSTIIIILFLIFAAFHWLLPNVIGGVGTVRDVLKPVKQTDNPTTVGDVLAPPVLFIPFEATNSAQIDIKGYATANSRVKIYLDDELKDTVSVDSNGNFVAKNMSLVLGKNNVYGKTIDEKNTESLPSKNVVVVFDNEKPTLEISQPEDGKTIGGGDKKVTVSGKADPDIPVLINSSRVITSSDGKFSTTISLNDGDNTISIKAVDNASNSTEIVRHVIYNP